MGAVGFSGRMELVDQFIGACTVENRYMDWMLIGAAGNGISRLLHFSPRMGHMSMLRTIVRSGWPSRNGHLEVIRLLLGNGAHVDADDDYALGMASHNGHFRGC